MIYFEDYNVDNNGIQYKNNNKYWKLTSFCIIMVICASGSMYYTK